MAKPKKRCAALLAQPGYIALRRSDPARTLAEPASTSLWSMPSTARWRIALDRATRLLQTISEQMQDYSDGRSEGWHAGQSADCFHENLEQVNELQARLDDIRSNF